MNQVDIDHPVSNNNIFFLGKSMLFVKMPASFRARFGDCL